MLNEMGIGLLLSAKDAATGVMEKVRGEFTRMGLGASEAGKRFDAAFKDFTSGALILGAGVAALGATWKVSKMAGDFENAVAEVTTLVDEASFPAAKIRQISLDMTSSFGGEARDQAKALYQTISAGVTDAAKATDLLTTANKLAVGGVTNVTAAVDALTNVVNAYSATGATATGVSDAMFVAIKAGKTTAAELAGSIGQVIPVASALNVSYTDLLASVAAMTTQGMNTAMSMTGLKAAFSNIQKPTADAVKEARRLHITFDAATLRAKGWAGFLDMITSSSKFTKDSISKLFGSVEAVGAVMNLTSNEGAKFNEILGQMDQRGGATQQAFDKMAASPGFQWNLVTAKFKVMLIELGNIFIPFWTKVASIGSKLFEGIRSGWATLPGPIKDVLGALKPFVATFVPVIGTLLVVGGGLKMIVAGARIAAIAFRALGIAGTTTSAILKASLIGMLITGALLVYEHWDTVKKGLVEFADRAERAWERIRAGASAAWDSLKGAFWTAINWMRTKADEVGDAIGSALSTAAKALETAFDKAVVYSLRTLFWLRDQVMKVPVISDVLRAAEDLTGVVTGTGAGDFDKMSRALSGATTVAEYEKNLATDQSTTTAGGGRITSGFATIGATESPGIAAIQTETARGNTPPPVPTITRSERRTETTHVHVNLDGREIAEAVESRIRDDIARGFGAVPEEA